MEIREITDTKVKRKLARQVLEGLTDWFEVEESREGFIRDCADWLFFAALEEEGPLGFLCLKETGKATVELAVMGVCRDHHRQGAGRKLVEAAKARAKELGYQFMQVKTVAMGMYPDYDDTNRFYQGVGFQELEVLPLWDEANPCQIYIMAL